MYKGGRQRSELENRGERRRQPVNTEDGMQARQGFAAAERRHEGSRGPEQRSGHQQEHSHLSPASAAGGLFLRSSENTL